ncbi:hypothetical protein KC726_03595 [Candidatus Woesebacteria bacterium]|nr:hypothetical protein [Candidatus Woesebacteria bacterium]
MKQRGEIATLLVLGSLVVIGISTFVTSSLNRQTQDVSTHASGPKVGGGCNNSAIKRSGEPCCAYETDGIVSSISDAAQGGCDGPGPLACVDVKENDNYICAYPSGDNDGKYLVGGGCKPSAINRKCGDPCCAYAGDGTVSSISLPEFGGCDGGGDLACVDISNNGNYTCVYPQAGNTYFCPDGTATSVPQPTAVQQQSPAPTRIPTSATCQQYCACPDESNRTCVTNGTVCADWQAANCLQVVPPTTLPPTTGSSSPSIAPTTPTQNTGIPLVLPSNTPVQNSAAPTIAPTLPLPTTNPNTGSFVQQTSTVSIDVQYSNLIDGKCFADGVPHTFQTVLLSKINSLGSGNSNEIIVESSRIQINDYSTELQLSDADTDPFIISMHVILENEDQTQKVIIDEQTPKQFANDGTNQQAVFTINCQEESSPTPTTQLLQPGEVPPRPDGISDGTWNTYLVMRDVLDGTPHLLSDGRFSDKMLLYMLMRTELQTTTGDVRRNALEAIANQYNGYGCSGKCTSLAQQLSWLNNMSGWFGRTSLTPIPLDDCDYCMNDVDLILNNQINVDDDQAAWWWGNCKINSPMCQYISEHPNCDVSPPWNNLLPRGCIIQTPITGSANYAHFVVVTYEQNLCSGCMGF